jgi:hypothetical protein
MAHNRCTLDFVDGSTTLTIKSLMSSDGKSWTPTFESKTMKKWRQVCRGVPSGFSGKALAILTTTANWLRTSDTAAPATFGTGAP